MPKEIVDISKDNPRITAPVNSTPNVIPQASNTTPPTPKKITTPKTQKTPPTPAKARSPAKPPPPPTIVEKEGKATLQPKIQTTRSGRTTQVPAKYKD